MGVFSESIVFWQEACSVLIRELKVKLVFLPFPYVLRKERNKKNKGTPLVKEESFIIQNRSRS